MTDVIIAIARPPWEFRRSASYYNAQLHLLRIGVRECVAERDIVQRHSSI
ncbi:MAG TPA: hypothetical protein VGX91_07080 [Candidatus Cybelea sp.]|jgi:hypothetical protein|nr:hypothetical protein [Candidatus Cybelea sp.]